MGSATPLLEVRGLETAFETVEGTVRPVGRVDLVIHEGEIVGLVGETGSGKTVLARSLMNRVRPPGRVVGGSVRYRGKELLGQTEATLQKVRGAEIAWIGSNPRSALDPVQRVGRQLADVVRAQAGCSRSEAWARGIELLARVQIPDPARRMAAYPHELSGGMAQRVIVAMALAHDPRLLIADEPTFGLDVTIQIQILDLIRDLARDTGAAALLVTQDLAVVAHYCDTVLVMYAGEIVEQGSLRDIVRNPVHPYARGLLASTIHRSKRGQRLETIPGTPPSLDKPPHNCSFAPRCGFAESRCTEALPPNVAIGAGRFARCILPEATESAAKTVVAP